MTNTVLGIDLGTQVLKVVFYDFDRREIAATGSAPLHLRQTDEGIAEQEAAWWLQALRTSLAAVDPAVRKSVRAVSVSGQQHGFVAIDKSGDVLAPVKLWCDTSTATESAEIMDAVGGSEACIRKTGNPILPGYTASKIRWLKKARQSEYDRMDGILLPHDFLNLYLTGERCMEMGDASGTGILDVQRREWSTDLLRAIDPERDLRGCLPRLATDNHAIGALRGLVAGEMGLPVGIPVGIGGGDNMMGAIGTGNVRPGNMTMSLGTSGTVYAYSDTPIVDAGGNIAAFCSSTGGWLPLLCTMNCTVSTELMRELFGVDISSFEAQIAKASRGADGVITLPFFNGERTPNLPNARACILGLNSHNTTPENLLRSAVEGATFALKFGIDELTTLGVEAEQIVLTGGGANSSEWRQLVADICATPVTTYLQNEAASFGAALQALQLLEVGASIAELTDAHLTRDEARCCEPSELAVEHYQTTFGEYQRAVAAATMMYA